jgi:hypothetical protein
MTIGTKHSQTNNSLSPGPGYYNSDLKNNTICIDFGKISKRSNPSSDPNLGPGTYNITDNLGDNLNNITIGHRRPAKTQTTIGPGEYSPEKAD